MDNSISKVIKLIQKTGDRCIVLDQAGNPIYVVMNFGSYENLVNASPDIDKHGEKMTTVDNDVKDDVSDWTDNNASNQWNPVKSIIDEKRSDFMPRSQNSNKKSKMVDFSAENLHDFEQNLLNEANNKESDGSYDFEPIE